jgi:hypothetical protein
MPAESRWVRSTPDRQNAGSTEPVRVRAIRAAPADPTHLLAMQLPSPGICTTSMARPNASVPVTQRRHGSETTARLAVKGLYHPDTEDDVTDVLI